MRQVRVARKGTYYNFNDLATVCAGVDACFGCGSRMSTGSKVGIAVGVVGGLGVLGLVLFWAFVSSSNGVSS